MAKFKIGQEVRFVNDLAKKTSLHITEISKITCPAGTQTFYSGRLWIEKQYSKGRDCTKDLWKANEIELEAIPNKKNNKFEKEKDMKKA